MICPHCLKDTDTIYETRTESDPITFGLSNRQWWSFTPGQIVEVTTKEMKLIQRGASLEEIMQMRQAGGSK